MIRSDLAHFVDRRVDRIKQAAQDIESLTDFRSIRSADELDYFADTLERSAERIRRTAAHQRQKDHAHA